MVIMKCSHCAATQEKLDNGSFICIYCKRENYRKREPEPETKLTPDLLRKLDTSLLIIKAIRESNTATYRSAHLAGQLSELQVCFLQLRELFYVEIPREEIGGYIHCNECGVDIVYRKTDDLNKLKHDCKN